MARDGTSSPTTGSSSAMKSHSRTRGVGPEGKEGALAGAPVAERRARKATLLSMRRAGVLAARFLLLFVVIAAAAALAGCGSSASEGERAALPRDVAALLARQSDDVALSVGRGDSCTALRRARALRASIERAIADRRIPAELHAELRQRASSLLKAIDCVVSAPPPRAGPGGTRRGDRHGHGEDEREKEED